MARNMYDIRGSKKGHIKTWYKLSQNGLFLIYSKPDKEEDPHVSSHTHLNTLNNTSVGGFYGARGEEPIIWNDSFQVQSFFMFQVLIRVSIIIFEFGIIKYNDLK